MKKQLTFRARQRRIKRQLRRNGWSRLTGNHRPVEISEAWNLEVYAAKYIAPRLKLLKKITHGYPVELDQQYPEGNEAFEHWLAMLDEMLFAFEYYADRHTREWTATEEDKVRVKRGLRLFAEWYDYLWY